MVSIFYATITGAKPLAALAVSFSDMKSFGQPTIRRNAVEKQAETDAALELWRETPKRAPAALDPVGVALFLRRNWLRILAAAALASAVNFAAMHFIFNKYSATAVVMVDPRAAKVTASGGVLSNIGSDAIAIESLVQASRSEAFLNDLVEKLGLDKDDYFGGKGATAALARQATIEKLAAKLSVSRRGTTYVIDVTATTPSPEKSAKIANTAAQMILDDQSELRTGASSKAAQTIEGRLAELRARVSRAEQAAAELKARLRVTDAGQGNTLLERRVFELNQQSVLAGAHTAEARARFELLRKAGAGAGDNLPQSVQSTVLSALRAEYARLSRQSADQSTVLGARHPEVASLNAQLADVRRQIGAEIGRMMAASRSEFLEAEQREASLSRQLREAQNESGQLGPELVKLGELEREAKAERAVYEQMLNRQRELTQVKDLEPSDIRIVSPAMPPAKPSPSRLLLAGAAAALGLMAGLAYALAREWRRGALKTARQAERLGGVEVAGFAPRIALASTDAIPDLTPWLADLCAELAPTGDDDAGLVILVASAQRGEGRSTVAANIAAYLAQGGGRTLLIEADRPSDAEKPRYGLLDVLESGEDLESAIVEDAGDGYALLPFGGRTLDAGVAVGALMSGVTLRATLKLVRQWYEVVVIDGPPALEAGYARLLAAQADATVFVVEWDKTSAADADAALDRLDVREAAVFYNKADAARLRLFDPAQSRRMTAQNEDISRAA